MSKYLFIVKFLSECSNSAAHTAAKPSFFIIGIVFALRCLLSIFTPLNPLALKRFKKILKWFFLVLLFLILAAYIFVRTPYGQNWIGQQVTKKLSKSLNTKVTVKHVSFSLLNNMHLEGLMVEDRLGDTILYAGNAKVRVTDWFVFKKEAELKYIGLENAVIKFQRPDSSGWRQQFLFDFLDPPATAAKKKAASNST